MAVWQAAAVKPSTCSRLHKPGQPRAAKGRRMLAVLRVMAQSVGQRDVEGILQRRLGVLIVRPPCGQSERVTGRLDANTAATTPPLKGLHALLPMSFKRLWRKGFPSKTMIQPALIYMLHSGMELPQAQELGPSIICASALSARMLLCAADLSPADSSAKCLGRLRAFPSLSIPTPLQ